MMVTGIVPALTVVAFFAPLFPYVVPTDYSELSPDVYIPSLGSVVGTMKESYFNRRPVFSFLGLNYAQSPSGKKRFRPPQKFPPWQGIYNATRMRQRCPQVDTAYYPPLDPDLIDEKKDSEDCLVLNVFTPKILQNDEEPHLPILFYIHGGSFYVGSAHDFMPEFLLEKDIVLVVIQYRLGPLGFASLQTDSIPGNAGMLDIVMALEWVQENIRWFGGDPKRVTVVGQSAGAAAASALLVSPMVPDGTFSQMILHSGSVLATWASRENSVSSTRAIAQLANCYSSDAQEIADCLRKTPVDHLIQAHVQYLDSVYPNQACFMVVQQAGGKRKFLTESPALSFEKGAFKKVSIMGGTTRDEGSAYVPDLFSPRPKASVEYFKRNVTKDALQYMGIVDNAVIDFYQNKYFQGVSNFAEASPALIDLVSVFFMKAPTNHIVRTMSSFKPSYLYSFNFKGNVSQLAASEPSWNDIYPFPTGVAHADDLGYLFPMAGQNYSERELKMVQTMVNLWTNFIIHGKPAPTPEVSLWSPMQDDFGPYLRIDEISAENQNIFFEYEVTQREGYVSSGGVYAHHTIITILLVPVSIQLIEKYYVNNHYISQF